MRNSAIHVKLLWAHGEFASRFKVTQALVGVVFLGGWFIAIASLSLFGSPVLRSGPSPFFLLTGVAVCFAIIPTGLLFSIARLSPLLFAAGDDQSMGSRRAQEACVVNLNRLLGVIVVLLVMAALTDISRSSGRASALQSTLSADAHFMSPEYIGPSLTQGWG